MLDAAFAASLAADFIAAFNSRRLAPLLAHYSEDVEFVSPLAAKVTGRPDGIVRGRAALGAYWEEALSRVPDLRLERVAVLAGMDCVTIFFRGIGGRLACDTLLIGPGGLAYRSFGQYLVE